MVWEKKDKCRLSIRETCNGIKSITYHNDADTFYFDTISYHISELINKMKTANYLTYSVNPIHLSYSIFGNDLIYYFAVYNLRLRYNSELKSGEL